MERIVYYPIGFISLNILLLFCCLQLLNNKHIYKSQYRIEIFEVVDYPCCLGFYDGKNAINYELFDKNNKLSYSKLRYLNELFKQESDSSLQYSIHFPNAIKYSEVLSVFKSFNDNKVFFGIHAKRGRLYIIKGKYLSNFHFIDGIKYYLNNPQIPLKDLLLQIKILVSLCFMNRTTILIFIFWLVLLIISVIKLFQVFNVP